MIKNKNKLLAIREYFGLTQRQLADLLVIGQNTISQIENGKISLTDRNKYKLVENLHINLLWLDSGVGEITCEQDVALAQIPQKKLSQKAETIIKTTSSQASGIPFFNIPIVNGAISEVVDFMEIKYDYKIDIKPFNEVEMYRPVVGESMSPKFKPTDIVACKRFPYHKNIQFGQTYLCIVKIDGQLFEFLRIIRKHDDEDKVILRPINDNFDDIVILANDIVELYIIKGLISFCD